MIDSFVDPLRLLIVILVNAWIGVLVFLGGFPTLSAYFHEFLRTAVRCRGIPSACDKLEDVIDGEQGDSGAVRKDCLGEVILHCRPDAFEGCCVLFKIGGRNAEYDTVDHTEHKYCQISSKSSFRCPNSIESVQNVRERKLLILGNEQNGVIEKNRKRQQKQAVENYLAAEN